MTTVQLDGDLSGLSERQKEFIREVAKKNGFIQDRILIESFGKSSDNFVADVKAITIIRDGKDDIRIIAKIAAQNEVARKMMQTELLFNAEMLIYTKVFPKFTSLEVSANVPENERLKYPKCYGCLAEAPHEMILLEDLKLKDYTMFDKYIPLGNDAVRLFLKNLAVYHSLSYVLKHLEPETFANFTNKLPDYTLSLTEGRVDKVFEQTEESAIAALDDDSHKKALRGVVSQFLNIYEKLQKFETSKHMVIQQGDPWTNNILFKVEDGKPVDAIMIDYQLCKAYNPTYDLHFMINNCTDYSTRSKYYHEWIGYYHDQIDKSLSNFGLKASFIYPRDQLESDLKRYSKLMFCVSVFIFGMMTRTDDEANQAKIAMKSDDLEAVGDNMNAANLSEDTLKLFKTKLTDLIDSYRELGYFP